MFQLDTFQHFAPEAAKAGAAVMKLDLKKGPDIQIGQEGHETADGAAVSVTPALHKTGTQNKVKVPHAIHKSRNINRVMRKIRVHFNHIIRAFFQRVDKTGNSGRPPAPLRSPMDQMHPDIFLSRSEER